MRGDGDGWVGCALGHRHWGRFGAAGLLLGDGSSTVLQHRAPWTHEGGTWGMPGGARDSHEDVVDAALREAAEEAAIDPAAVRPFGLRVDDHGGWSYTTVVAAGSRRAVRPYAANAESAEVRWWADAEIGALPLHDGFAGAWPDLHDRPGELVVLVDAANVVGSRPDGWWRDRPAATGRLIDRLSTLARLGVAPVDLPAAVDGRGLTLLLPHIVIITEGAARTVHIAADGDWRQRAVRVAHAPGEGDPELLRQLRDASDGNRLQLLVVTADRELRVRAQRDATVVGPTWLLNLLSSLPPP